MDPTVEQRLDRALLGIHSHDLVHQEHVLVVHEGLEEPLDLGQVEGTVKRTRHPG